MLALFVIQLIDGFHWLARDQAGNEAGLIRGEGSQHIDAWIKSHKQVRIKMPSRFFLRLIDHFDHIVIRFWNNTNLLHRGWLLPGFPDSPKLTHRDLPNAQLCLPDASEFKDQQIAPLCFMQVFGQARSPLKLLGVLTVHLHGFKKSGPGLMQLEKHLIGNFGRKRLVGISRFKQMKESRGSEVFLLKNEGLPDMVIGEVPEVF